MLGSAPWGSLHYPLKHGRHIAQPERHAVTLEEAHVANSKCGVLLQHFIHLDLPESGLQVQA